MYAPIFSHTHTRVRKAYAFTRTRTAPPRTNNFNLTAICPEIVMQFGMALDPPTFTVIGVVVVVMVEGSGVHIRQTVVAVARLRTAHASADRLDTTIGRDGSLSPRCVCFWSGIPSQGRPSIRTRVNRQTPGVPAIVTSDYNLERMCV